MPGEQIHSSGEKPNLVHTRSEIFNRFTQTGLNRFLFENAQNNIAVLDAAGKIILINTAFAELLGGKPEEFSDKPLQNLLQEELFQAISQEIKQILAAGEDVTRERYVTVESNLIHLKLKPLIDEDGQMPAVLMIANNIAGRNKAALKIDVLEAGYTQLFTTAQEAILIADDEGNFVDANPVACALLGYTKKELLELSSWAITPGVNQEDWTPLWKKFIEDGAMSGEYQVACKDGTILDMHFNAIANYIPGHHLSMLTDITARKQAERALEASATRYQTLFDNSREGIFLINDEGQIIDTNAQFCNMIGIEKEKLLQLTIFDLPLHEKIIPMGNKYWELLQSEGKIKGELPLLLADGKKVFIDFYAQSNISPGQHMVVVHDVTARKKAEKKLIESEARYSQLVVKSPSTILVAQNGKYVFANPEAAKVLGYDNPADVLGLNIFETISEKSLATVTERMDSISHGKRNKFSLLEIIRPDGTTRLIENTIAPYVFDGEPAILLIGYDVTEHHFTASRLSSFYQVAPIGAGVIADRRFVEVNRQFCDITGYSAEEIVGQPARMLYFTEEEYQEVGRKKMQQIQEKGEATVETCFRRKDGEAVHVLLNSMPLDPADPSKGLSATALDITERKQAEEALQRMNEELEERVKKRTAELQQRTNELESFTYSISHDLRAPLRAVNGFSEILRSEHIPGEDSKAAALLDRILAASKHMDMLIEGMLQLAEVGQQSLHPVPVDLGEIAQETYNQLAESYPERQIEAEFKKGKTVWADPGLMKVVFSSLLGNALKFSQNADKAEIKFGSKKDKDGKPVFFIKDNGTGFDQAYSDKLFVPFQRLEENDQFEGLGLGLAVAKKIIHRHNGEIWAEAEKDKGATFYFNLNAAPK